jgi:hypothetical protein
MKKSQRKTSPARRPVKAGQGYEHLITAISAINTRMVGQVATVANQALVLRNWMVGAHIVEYQQHGADRAKYGARLLETMAEDLKAKGIKGLGLTTLKFCRLFALTYEQIGRTVSGQLLLAAPETSKSQTVSDFLLPGVVACPATSSADSRDSVCQGMGAPASELPTPLTAEEIMRFSWSQLQELIRIEDPWKRAFYENEILLGHWSVRQLQRQIESLLYERTGLSTNKKAVIERARKQEPQESIADMLLCSDKDGAEVEFATAGMDQKLFVARYLTALPSAEQLKAFLERDREEMERNG